MQGVLDSQPSLVPSRLPVELPGPGASELYILPAVKPDSEYLQLRICGTSLQPGLVNIQSWAMQMLFVVSYRKPEGKGEALDSVLQVLLKSSSDKLIQACGKIQHLAALCKAEMKECIENIL